MEHRDQSSSNNNQSATAPAKKKASRKNNTQGNGGTTGQSGIPGFMPTVESEEADRVKRAQHLSSSVSVPFTGREEIDEEDRVYNSGYQPQFVKADLNDPDQFNAFQDYRENKRHKYSFSSFYEEEQGWLTDCIFQATSAAESITEAEELNDGIVDALNHLDIVEQSAMEINARKSGNGVPGADAGGLIPGKHSVLHVVAKEPMYDFDNTPMVSGGLTNAELSVRNEPTALIRRIANKDRQEALIGSTYKINNDRIRQGLQSDYEFSSFLSLTNQSRGFCAEDLFEEQQDAGKASVAQQKFFSQLPVIKEDDLLDQFTGTKVFTDLNFQHFTTYDTVEQINTLSAIKKGVNTMVSLACHLFGGHMLPEWGAILKRIVDDQTLADFTEDCILFIAMSIMLIVREFWNRMRRRLVNEDGSLRKMTDGGWQLEWIGLVKVIKVDINSAALYTIKKLPGILASYKALYGKKKSSAAAAVTEGEVGAMVARHLAVAEKRARDSREERGAEGAKKARPEDRIDHICVGHLASLVGVPDATISHCTRPQCRFIHDLSKWKLKDVLGDIESSRAGLLVESPDLKRELVTAIKSSRIF